MNSENILKNPLHFCLKNKNAYYCLAFLILQQVIVASSTLWIVRLSQNVISGSDFYTNLILYITSLTSPYFPAAVMSVFLVKWKQSLIKNYIYLYINSNAHDTNLWSDKKKREEYISAVNHEGSQTISQAVEYYFGLASAGMNTIFNILVIAFLIDYLFIATYALSIAFSFFLIKIQNKFNITFALKAQKSRINLGKSILSSWDNVVLGNAYNHKIWKKSLDERIQQSIKDNVDSTVFREIVSIGISLVTFLPSIALAAYGMYSHKNDPIALAGLLVIMPRLFLILSYTYNLLYLIMQFGSMKNQLSTILNVSTFNKNENLSHYLPRIDWSSIKLHGNQDNASPSLNSLLNSLQLPGRITIRGKNGGGKSSLLLELKRMFKDEAFYLPSQNHLDFAFGEVDKSTGELIREQLEEIENHVESKIILLDEWDANLDMINQTHLSQMIDKISHTKCVVEVRHR